MAMEMRLPVARKPLSESLGRETKKHLVVPGDTITTDTGFMRYVGSWGTLGYRSRRTALHVACWPKPGPSVLFPLRPRGTQGTSAEHPSRLVFEASGLLLPALCVSPSAFAPARRHPPLLISVTLHRSA